MSHEKLANFVFYFHVAWVLWMLASIPLALNVRNSWIKAACLATGWGTVACQVATGGCPLVFLEWSLRGKPSPAQGFIAYYICKWCGFSITGNTVFIVGLVLTVMTTAIVLTHRNHPEIHNA